MFTGNKYITRGINEKIPRIVQGFLWTKVMEMQEAQDYLQIFHLRMKDNKLEVVHSQEVPEYRKVYVINVEERIEDTKIYIIDDGEHCTMLLAEEY